MTLTPADQKFVCHSIKHNGRVLRWFLSDEDTPVFEPAGYNDHEFISHGSSMNVSPNTRSPLLFEDWFCKCPQNQTKVIVRDLNSYHQGKAPGARKFKPVI